MRYQSTESLGYNPTVFSIGYHIPGYYALQGAALMMINIRKEIKKVYLLLALFLTFLVALYSGARQTIVIALVLLFLWGIMNQKSKWKSFLLVTLLLSGSIWIFFNIQSIQELFGSTVQQGYVEGGGRGLWLLKGVELFFQNPIFGVGFGRYSLWGIYGTYPHNIIIEMLCEIGVVGFLASVALILPLLVKTRQVGKVYIYYLAVLVFHAMASGGLESNVIIFAFIFALPYLSRSFHNSFI